jgi:hypothetical protein
MVKVLWQVRVESLIIEAQKRRVEILRVIYKSFPNGNITREIWNKKMRDVFHAYLVKGAQFTEGEELPCIESCNEISESLISFSSIKKTTNYNQFIHFYEEDRKIECFWHNPKKYLPQIKEFKGIITPDFSLYRDMPLVQQKWNAYRGRALGFWLQKQGVAIIPNIRYGDERTYAFCFDGVPQNSVIAIGTHGCIKHTEDMSYHIKGIEETIKRLRPRTIIVYGAIPDNVFAIHRHRGHNIVVCKSNTAEVFSKESKWTDTLFDDILNKESA